MAVILRLMMLVYAVLLPLAAAAPAQPITRPHGRSRLGARDAGIGDHRGSLFPDRVADR